MYTTICPKCRRDDGLAIVRATVDTDIPLSSEGFSIYDGRNTDTHDEIVRCGWCGAEYPLEALTEPTCGHSACRQHWIDTGQGGCTRHYEEAAREKGWIPASEANAGGPFIHRDDDVFINTNTTDPLPHTDAKTWMELCELEGIRTEEEPGIPDEAYVEAACKLYHRDGDTEIDPGATVSRGEDSGAYVQAWIWVDDSDIAPDTAGIEVEESVTSEQLAANGFADPRQ